MTLLDSTQSCLRLSEHRYLLLKNSIFLSELVKLIWIVYSVVFFVLQLLLKNAYFLLETNYLLRLSVC